MVAQRPGEKNTLIGTDQRLRMGVNVEIVEEVHRSKIGQCLAYPGSTCFSRYQSEWKDLTNGCLSRAAYMLQAHHRLETRPAASKFLSGFQQEAQGTGHDGFP